MCPRTKTIERMAESCAIRKLGKIIRLATRLTDFGRWPLEGKEGIFLENNSLPDDLEAQTNALVAHHKTR